MRRHFSLLICIFCAARKHHHQQHPISLTVLALLLGRMKVSLCGIFGALVNHRSLWGFSGQQFLTGNLHFRATIYVRMHRPKSAMIIIYMQHKVAVCINPCPIRHTFSVMGLISRWLFVLLSKWWDSSQCRSFPQQHKGIKFLHFATTRNNRFHLPHHDSNLFWLYFEDALTRVRRQCLKRNQRARSW